MDLAKRFKVPILLFGSLIAILSVACSSDAEEEAAPAAPAAAAPAAAAPAPAAAAPATAESEMVKDVWGNSVRKPIHGGTIPIATNVAPEIFDPWHGDWVSVYGEYIWDDLCTIDWALPRDEVDLTAGYKQMSMYEGELATSWDISSDLTTYTFHLREDAFWHDKTPTNGRQFVASDVKYSWDRVRGLGDFSEAGASPHDWLMGDIEIDEITVTDDQTVVVHSAAPSLENIGRMCGIGGPWTNSFVPREVIEEFGDMKAWENVSGTGPYTISGFTAQSKIEFTRNPNYFGIDPVYPGQDLQLPYSDRIDIHVMPDAAARVAAMRTGKTAMQGGQHLNNDQVSSLKETNPELSAVKITGTSKSDPAYYLGAAPFSIWEVRLAMQKAINFDEIIDSYYKGDADRNHWGFAPGPAAGYYTPYQDWPEDVKQQFVYDPDEAGRLLDEAGYPLQDGVRFEGNWMLYGPYGHDVDLALLVASYWDKIGVKVTVEQAAEESSYSDNVRSANYGVEDGSGAGGMLSCGCRHKNFNPMVSNKGRFDQRMDGAWLNTGMKDGPKDYSDYWAIMDKASAATTQEELLRHATEMDDYFIKDMFTLSLPVVTQYMMVQPWLMGYQGEDGGGDEGWMVHLMYTWVDQDLQKEMGHD